jgi:hypothetical protein
VSVSVNPTRARVGGHALAQGGRTCARTQVTDATVLTPLLKRGGVRGTRSAPSAFVRAAIVAAAVGLAAVPAYHRAHGAVYGPDVPSVQGKHVSARVWVPPVEARAHGGRPRARARARRVADDGCRSGVGDVGVGG